MTVDLEVLEVEAWIRTNNAGSTGLIKGLFSSSCYGLTLGRQILGYYLKLSDWCFDFEHFVNLIILTCIYFENLTQYLVESCNYFICISLFDVLFFIKELIVLNFVTDL